ncbi:MAG: LacI family DNA-binding transcriptional regulator [Clostridia bacterium]|nr:LacI family DNA-binding transcriptional regulator [Clostridia bacterium]
MMANTIYDLAKAAGVSIATVSRALNDHYAVSEETKKRVQALAEEMDYRPNARARCFAKQKSGNVLFITDLHRNVAFENPHMFEIMTGISQYLDEKNYALLLKHATTKDGPQMIKELMIREQADGVIIHAAILSKALAGMLHRLDTPHLVIGKPDFPTPICWMDVNHELAGQKAATYLLDRGYRRMVFLMGDQETDKISAARRDGMLQMFAEEELSFTTLYGDSTYESGIYLAERALEMTERPEILLCTNNYLAMACLQVVRQRCLSVPEDIAIMTFDNYPFSMLTQPQLTAVEADMFDMGKEAARFILRKIRMPELQTQSYCTIPRIIERETT